MISIQSNIKYEIYWLYITAGVPHRSIMWWSRRFSLCSLRSRKQRTIWDILWTIWHCWISVRHNATMSLICTQLDRFWSICMDQVRCLAWPIYDRITAEYHTKLILQMRFPVIVAGSSAIGWPYGKVYPQERRGKGFLGFSPNLGFVWSLAFGAATGMRIHPKC